MKEVFLSVIIPVYNESDRLPSTLRDVVMILAARDWRCEIIIVDDGSTDGTAGRVAELAAGMPPVKLLSHERNLGKGAAVRTGMLAASGKWRLFMDADNSTSLTEFDAMYTRLAQGCDVVIGSRAVPGARLEPPQPAYKRILGIVGNRIIRALLPLKICDTQCGFKCFSAAAAENIFRITRIDRWGFDAEVLTLAVAMGNSVAELPVCWRCDPRSHVRLRDYFSVLADTIRTRLRLSRGEYPLNVRPRS